MFESWFLHLRDTSPALPAPATIVGVLLVGTSAQILADRLRLPATGLWLPAGLLFDLGNLPFTSPTCL